ncbi:MAG TPA: TIGR03435 family protein, partial [Candidatus Acidoferrum sp.]|nr:TIGR03435 family protein [Candidatus Acidoferrum sp.]
GAALDSRRFEVVAKLPEGTAKKDIHVMLQHLLEQRFKLSVHREQQEGRYYELSIDKAAFKLKPTSKVPPEHGSVEADASGNVRIPQGPLVRPVTVAGRNMMTMVTGDRALIMGNAQPMSALAPTLASCIDAPVRDLTNLTGEYDIRFDFAIPAGMRVRPAGPPGECPTCAVDVEPPPTVFQALREKLGLRLDAKRGLVDVLVIDHADAVPTEN